MYVFNGDSMTRGNGDTNANDAKGGGWDGEGVAGRAASNAAQQASAGHAACAQALDESAEFGAEA